MRVPRKVERLALSAQHPVEITGTVTTFRGTLVRTRFLPLSRRCRPFPSFICISSLSLSHSIHFQSKLPIYRRAPSSPVFAEPTFGLSGEIFHSGPRWMDGFCFWVRVRMHTLSSFSWVTLHFMVLPELSLPALAKRLKWCIRDWKQCSCNEPKFWTLGREADSNQSLSDETKRAEWVLGFAQKMDKKNPFSESNIPSDILCH